MNFPAVLRNTILKDWKTCPWRTALEWFHGFRHDDGEFQTNKTDEECTARNTHLVAGAAFARGCEIVREEYFFNQTPIDVALIKGIKGLTKKYGNHQPFMAPYKNWQAMVAALEYYFIEAFPIESDHLTPIKGGVEFAFAIPIPRRDGKGYYMHPDTGSELMYTGRADMIAQDEELGVEVIQDDKTTGRLGSIWFEQWEKESQFRSYSYVCREYGRPIEDIVIRGVAIPSSQKAGFSHAQHRLTIAEEHIDSWLETTQLIIEEMLWAYENQKFRKLLSSDCAWKRCPFIGNCEIPQAELLPILSADYHVQNAEVIE